MSWPHVLSFSRIVVGPVIAALVLARPGSAYLIAAVLFALASVTDLADGRLARHSQSVSPLGVFLDTTADKILVGLTLTAMGIAGLTPAWVPLTILGREFFISGLRSYAATCGRVISAHIWGKGKAAITMVAICLVLFAADGKAGGALAGIAGHSVWSNALRVSGWLLDLSAVLTIVSGLRYVIDAWPLFVASEAEERSTPQRRMAAGGDR